jgi:hypothetical protein
MAWSDEIVTLAVPAISLLALALSFLMLAAEKVKKHSSPWGRSKRRTTSCSLLHGMWIETGLALSANHFWSWITGAGLDTSCRSSLLLLPPPRLISDQALKNAQKVVPSPTHWTRSSAPPARITP